MKFDDFQKRSQFGRAEIQSYARGELLSDAKPGLPPLSDYFLLAFHEVKNISWDEKTGTGRIEAVRHNRLDDWYYACHFIGDPVMPGCFGIDAIWQCMKFFAAWRGLSGCDKALGMENVLFFGQIRPMDQRITYTVDIVSIEQSDGEFLITAKAAVAVDAMPVYTIGTAQIGSAFWEKPALAAPKEAAPHPAAPFLKKLSYEEFADKNFLSQAEVVALSQAVLIDNPPFEMSLLPSSLMLGLDEVQRIAYDPASGEGVITAVQHNNGLEWFYPMDRNEKPAALLIDSVWQIMGLFLAWRKTAGTGRALGFERVEIFDVIKPQDRRITYEVQVLKFSQSAMTGDAFAKADAQVFADGRLILSCSNANVGCHRNIRYSNYPQAGEMAFGGKLKTQKPDHR